MTRSSKSGGIDALASDTRDAVSVLFALQGSANASTGALERVVLHALGYEPKTATASCCPSWGDPMLPARATDSASRCGAPPCARRRLTLACS